MQIGDGEHSNQGSSSFGSGKGSGRSPIPPGRSLGMGTRHSRRSHAAAVEAAAHATASATDHMAIAIGRRVLKRFEGFGDFWGHVESTRSVPTFPFNTML